MRRFGILLMLLSVTGSAMARRDEPATPAAEPPAERMAVLAGRVLMKDGVTPVRQAELVLTDANGEARFRDRTARGGRYKVRLPVGTYRLQIVRGSDVYTSPSVFRISDGVRNQIDFLIVRDFENAASPNDPTRSIKRGPDPPTGLMEVGTVVDVVHEKSASRWRRWAETLGFIGSLLLVSLAAG